MSAADTGTQAAGYCRHCGKALTTDTLREVQGAFYCPECLASWVGAAQPRTETRGGGRAAKAAVLGIIPGLGAVYNGDYVKALIHVLVFGTIISLIERAPGIFVPALVAWIFYMPFEAYQTAAANERAGSSGIGKSEAQLRRRRESLGPILLIVIGSLWLADDLNLIDFDRVREFWPLGFIALGVWLLMRRTER